MVPALKAKCRDSRPTLPTASSFRTMAGPAITRAMTDNAESRGVARRPPDDPLGRTLHAATRAVALTGGALLVGLALLSTASIVGRSLFAAPVPGDYELVEVGAAVAVFAFLPYAQMVGGNVVVDFFTTRLPARGRAGLDRLGALIYAALSALLTWRVAVGGIELRRYGETTMVLGVPLWWGFVPAVACLALLTVVCLYTAGRLRHAERRA